MRVTAGTMIAILVFVLILVLYKSFDNFVGDAASAAVRREEVINDRIILPSYGNETVTQLTSRSRLLQQTLDVCEGYFCDKYLHSMVIIMTHNSLATPMEVFSPSQNNDIVTQFRDGIRGFNLDLYDKSDGTLFTMHGPGIETSPVATVRSLVQEMRRQQYRNEFILVQLQDEMTTQTGVENAIGLFGNLLITNFDITLPLSYYIERNKRILLVSNKNAHVAVDDGMHSSNVLITENTFDWQNNCLFSSMPTDYWRGPRGTSTRSNNRARLMNSFCTQWGIGDPNAASIVNAKERLLYNARDYMRQTYTNGVVNIIMVDFYDYGEPFEAQDALRNRGAYDGCLEDRTRCSTSSTCWSCCSNKFEVWAALSSPACGYEEDYCRPHGEICYKFMTCGLCCNGSNCPWYGRCKCT